MTDVEVLILIVVEDGLVQAALNKSSNIVMS